MKNINIKIIIDHEKIIPFVLDIREFKRCLESVLDFLEIESFLEIKPTNDVEMEKLNRKFLHLDGPTNVLSFPSDEDSFLGSICVSVDTIIREADLYHQPVKEYFYRMIVHGILHLAGYNHGDVMDMTTESILDHLKDNGCIEVYEFQGMS